MLTMTETPDAMRTKIIHDLRILDMDELKRLYNMIAVMAAEKAIKFAGIDWEEKNISREKINKAVKQSRQSNK